MNLDTFFEKFEQFADAPNAVAKMRELVLHLAVRGKLVAQAPSDESADECLARSLDERQKLKRTTATSVRQIDGEAALTYDIPASWRWQTLDDILIFGPTNGFSPKAVDYETPVRSLTLSATTSGRFKGEYSKFITTEVPAESDLWLQDGDVLVQRGNTIEYVGIAAVYRGESNRFVYPDLMMKFRVSSAFDVGFIHLAMSQEAARDFLRARASGTSGSMPKINQATLKSLPLPIPPLAEQKRIVAKVDELMALCDRLEAQQKERETRHTALAHASLTRFADAPTPGNLELLFHKAYSIPAVDLRKAVLSLAVQGLLVPQDPDDAPADKLLKQIDYNRHELIERGAVPKQKDISEITADECQHSIPEGWQWVRLQRIAEVIDPNPSHRMPRYCERGVPFISTENFVGLDEIDFTIGKQVSDSELEDQKNRFTIRPGSFALSRIGTIGKTRSLPSARNYCMSHALVVIAPYSQDIDSRFLRVVVTSDAVQGQATAGAKSIGVPDLGMAKIRSFAVPLPPLPEQRRIVAKVDQLMALVDQLEAQLVDSRAKAAKLMEAVVAELSAAA